MAIVKRLVKGSPLTHAELDNNFTELENAIPDVTEINQDLNRLKTYQLEVFNPNGISVDYSGYYDPFTVTENLELNLTDGEEGIWQLVPLTFDGTTTLSKGIAFISGQSFVDGETVAAGVYDLWITYIGGKYRVNLDLQEEAEIIDPGDTTPPELTAASISNLTPNTINLTFNEAVNISSTGWSVSTSVGSLSITGAAGGNLNLSRAVVFGETITLSYSGGTTEDLAGNPLGAITDFAVTNNVQEVVQSFINTHSLVTTAKQNGINITDNSIWPQSGSDDLPISIELWLKVTNIDKTGYFIAFNNSGAGIRLYHNLSGQIVMEILSSSGNRIASSTPLSNIVQNTWYQIIGIYTGSKLNSGISIFKDAVSQTLANINLGTYAGLNAASDAIIQLPLTNDSASFFHGKSNLARIYNKALSGAEVTTLRNSGVPRGVPSELLANCVLEVRFNNNNQSTIGTNGTTVGTLTFDTDVPS